MSSCHLFGSLVAPASPYVFTSSKMRRWPLLAIVIGLGTASVLALLGSLPQSDRATANQKPRVYSHTYAGADVISPPAVSTEQHQTQPETTITRVAGHGSLSMPAIESQLARPEMALAKVPEDRSAISLPTQIIVEPAASAQSQPKRRSSTTKSSSMHRTATRKSPRRERIDTFRYGSGYWGLWR